MFWSDGLTATRVSGFTREVCRMKLRLYRNLAGLYLSKFALQSKGAVLCIARKF
jgi:hypothetical protein